MKVVLTIISGMGPHTISVTWDGVVGMLGVCQSCALAQPTTVDSMVCLMSRFEEKSFYLSVSHSSFLHSMHHYFLQV
jgi:hypothetical protein